MVRNSLLILFLCTSSFWCVLNAQNIDTDTINRFEGEIQQISHEDLEFIHSPKKASILSACTPGAGQIYNKKYWKLPIIWGGIGASIYLAEIYKERYHFYLNEYILELDYPNTQSQFHGQTTVLGLKNTKDSYRKWMETSYVVAGAIYIMQILDANVDAQLMTFDVSEDLSLHITPEAIPNQLQPQPTMGVTLALQFK